jgi:starch synthase
MQAMRYGTVPVVTDVGGLHDTVVDLDDEPRTGTGIVAAEVSTPGVLDALHRGARAVGDAARLAGARRRGMTHDWSWRGPALEHLAHYERLVAAHAAATEGSLT